MADHGCYYSGKYKTFVYARQYKIPDTISVEIRHYADPVISASETTRGCSDFYAYGDSAHSCFGMKKSTQIVLGICFLVAAVIIVVAVIAIAIGGAKCIKGMTKKQSPASVPLATAVPTAQPAPSVQMPYQNNSVYAPPQGSVPVAQPYQGPQIPTAQPAQSQMYYAPPAYGTGL